MPARALLRMVTVETVPEPYNRIQLKIFYPALAPKTEADYQTGVLPFDTQWSPAPMMIFLPGVNCSAHTYEWLAQDLANCGIVTVIASWIAENLPNRISISPGIDIEAVQQDIYGARPTSSSLKSILEAVDTLRDESELAGHLRDDIILGGHSAGGTMALQNARHDWFSSITGSIAFCANPLATSVLGNWDKGAIPAMPTDVPVLMMGATEDGIGDHHVRVFGNSQESGAEYLCRLFNEANYHNSILSIFEGANHHTICYPPDHSIGRIFMDSEATGDEAHIRADISQLVIQFIKNILFQQDIIERPSTATIWQHV